MSDAQSSNARRGGGFFATVVLLLMVGLAAGVAWELGWLDREPAQPQPHYVKLGPELVVNFDGGGRVRYLQLGVEVMTYDKEALPALELHTPLLRNNLILLLSDQTYDELITREGKERLAATALEEMRKVMAELYGQPVIETLYFTTFVMQ